MSDLRSSFTDEKFVKNLSLSDDSDRKGYIMSANQRVFPAETRLTVYRRRNIPPPSVFVPELLNSKFGPAPVSNCNISASRAYLEISSGRSEDIVSKNRSVPKMVQNDYFLTNLPRKESLCWGS